MERLLTGEQLAQLLNVSSRTIRNWRGRRGLPVYMVGGTVPRYRESEVEEWLRQSKITSPVNAG